MNLTWSSYYSRITSERIPFLFKIYYSTLENKIYNKWKKNNIYKARFNRNIKKRKYHLRKRSNALYKMATSFRQIKWWRKLKLRKFVYHRKKRGKLFKLTYVEKAWGNSRKAFKVIDKFLHFYEKMFYFFTLYFTNLKYL